MNQYGEQAMAHWQRWLPGRYDQIPNPRDFFTDLGQQVATQIAELSAELAGEDPPQEQYLEKVGRLNAARQRAEETILAEQILLPPEPGTQDSDPPGSSSQPEDPWSPLLEDPSSPYWAAAERRRQEDAL
jgi:hypothetical protein